MQGTFCQYQPCTITYRWREIPNTLRPTFEVGHGDGFQIVVHSAPEGMSPHDTVSSVRTARSSSNEQSSHSASLASTGNAAAMALNPAHAFTTICHLYTLQGAYILR